MKKLSPERAKLVAYINEPELPPEPDWEVDACAICGAEPNVSGQTVEEVAADLYKQGWRERCSDSYQLIGLLCPKCIPHRHDPTWEGY